MLSREVDCCFRAKSHKCTLILILITALYFTRDPSNPLIFALFSKNKINFDFVLLI